jgi:histidinol-phosphate aminotransferase
VGEFLRPANDKLFSWILSLGPTAKYNLTSSGLSEPNLSQMGIDTSYERFAAEKGEHERLFVEEVARIYKTEPENVVATSGASEAIFLVYSVLGAGCRAVVPLPNYGPMFTVPKSLGMELRTTLSSPPASHKKTIFGLTDPNNPTGRSLDREAVDTLAVSTLKKKNAVFINETYREFTFPDSPITHFGSAPNVVICSTMTKFYGLGRLRVGWIMADRGTARRMLYAKWAVSGHDSEYSMWIATQVLRRRQKFVDRAHQIYSRNVSLVRRFISETPEASTEVGAAPFCLVHYKKGARSPALATTLLKETGVLVSPGDFFGASSAFRLCFTSEDEEALREGLRELSSFLRRQST